MWCSDRQRILAIVINLASLLASASAIADGTPFVLGAGVEIDSEDGLAGSVVADVEIGVNTWLFGSAGGTQLELPRQQETTSIYAEVGVDHYFDPAGVRLSFAHWADSDFLESNDALLTLYSRGENSMLGIDLEYRDFNLSVPSLLLLPARAIPFSSSALGFHGRVGITENLDFRISGRKYDYDADIRLETSDRILDLLSVSRLSLLSSLVDWRAGAGIGFNFGSRRLQLDVSRWQGVADGSRNTGLTMSFLTPMTRRTDVEVSLGRDESNVYGEVTVLSVFVYFYGGT